ncbi:hypothetical protein vBAbaMPhT2_036 [Acinetobacter phage vB_AbaM_PhT2]|uniref:Uncharacterized protein n=1 Tax=Acinetobacter phage vB_AbaM_PhT2 TaxID=2690230 RepID=A0A6B9SYM7_9CAUD|nr:hypothetical protein HYQ24_gp036 [Acinetobacter phage vB_AbaM_PhT2]QHJ75648.1 hypothetical protein vBAbaMPhT2_036 [Acinetobacter phage vB_AbaM_PhT2]
MYKCYKVINQNIVGKVLGNSLRETLPIHQICKEEYIKIFSDGRVTNMYDVPIWRMRYQYHENRLLILSKDDLELFEECADPGTKKVSNIKYQVVTHDYDGCLVVETHDSAETAAKRCGYLNEVSPEYHEVHVEFDYEWEN